MKSNSSKRLTIYDVAEKTGVSIATVSRVMNNAPNVNEHTRLKILKLLNRTSYKPKVVKNRIPCIGVLLEAEGMGLNLFSDYNSFILSGVSDYVFKYGLALSVFPFSSRETRQPDELMRNLQERGINGTVIIYRRAYAESLRSLHSNMFPHFSIGGGTEITPCSVFFEEKEAVEIALDYLIGLGHRRIGFVHADYDNDSPVMRLNAFREITKAKGCADCENLIFLRKYNPSHKELGYETIMEFKERILENPPEALLCLDDNIAAGVLKAFSEINIRVPEDVSIIGFNNSEFSEYVHPPLTSISHPYYDMGYYAAEHVHCWINGGQLPCEKRVFPPELVIRKSCGKPGESRK